MDRRDFIGAAAMAAAAQAVHNYFKQEGKNQRDEQNVSRLRL